MNSLRDFIKKETRKKYSIELLHKIFKNELLDLNDTIIGLLDKYCSNGGYVMYECQDQLLISPSELFKVDTAVISIPEEDIRFDIDVYKNEDKNSYNIYIKWETLIIIEGEEIMQSLKESIQLSQAINEAEDTELYKYISTTLEKAIKEGKPFDEVVDEGIFGSILGGISGATIGPAIMKAVCKALGIDERGTLGSLMTSRLVLASIGGTLGYKI